MNVSDSDGWSALDGGELATGHAAEVFAYPHTPGPPAPPEPVTEAETE